VVGWSTLPAWRDVSHCPEQAPTPSQSTALKRSLIACGQWNCPTFFRFFFFGQPVDPLSKKTSLQQATNDSVGATYVWRDFELTRFRSVAENPLIIISTALYKLVATSCRGAALRFTMLLASSLTAMYSYECLRCAGLVKTLKINVFTSALIKAGYNQSRCAAHRSNAQCNVCVSAPLALRIYTELNVSVTLYTELSQSL